MSPHSLFAGGAELQRRPWCQHQCGINTGLGIDLKHSTLQAAMKKVTPGLSTLGSTLVGLPLALSQDSLVLILIQKVSSSSG